MSQAMGHIQFAGRLSTRDGYRRRSKHNRRGPGCSRHRRCRRCRRRAAATTLPFIMHRASCCCCGREPAAVDQTQPRRVPATLQHSLYPSEPSVNHKRLALAVLNTPLQRLMIQTPASTAPSTTYQTVLKRVSIRRDQDVCG